MAASVPRLHNCGVPMCARYLCGIETSHFNTQSDKGVRFVSFYLLKKTHFIKYTADIEIIRNILGNEINFKCHFSVDSRSEIGFSKTPFIYHYLTFFQSYRREVTFVH